LNFARRIGSPFRNPGVSGSWAEGRPESVALGAKTLIWIAKTIALLPSPLPICGSLYSDPPSATLAGTENARDRCRRAKKNGNQQHNEN
jgi:hypothetical protein